MAGRTIVVAPNESTIGTAVVPSSSSFVVVAVDAIVPIGDIPNRTVAMVLMLVVLYTGVVVRPGSVPYATGMGQLECSGRMIRWCIRWWNVMTPWRCGETP